MMLDNIMTGKEFQILIDFGRKLTEDVRVIIPTVSGEMKSSIELKEIENGFQILGHKFIKTLDTGRKPTGSGASSSGETLYQKIQKWVKLKGIQPIGNISQKSLAYLITRSIHRHGTQLYRIYKGKSSGFFEQVINQKVLDSFYEQFINKKELELTTEVLENIR